MIIYNIDVCLYCYIAESKPDESKHQYLEALIWMRRLGNAAKLGIQVVMKQLSELSQANPVSHSLM